LCKHVADYNGRHCSKLGFLDGSGVRRSINNTTQETNRNEIKFEEVGMKISAL